MYTAVLTRLRSKASQPGVWLHTQQHQTGAKESTRPACSQPSWPSGSAGTLGKWLALGTGRDGLEGAAHGHVGSNTPLSAARPTFNLQEGKNGNPTKMPESEITPHNPRLSRKQSATPTAAARPGLGNHRGTSPGFLIQFLQDSGLHWPTHRFWLELC